MKTLLTLLCLTLIGTHSLTAQNDRRDVRNRGTNLPDQALEHWEPHQFEGMPFRLLLPKDYDPNQKYPLILNLHGRAGIGDDNKSQLRPWSRVFTNKDWRDQYRCIMIAPQSWDSWSVFGERYPELTEKDIKNLPPAWHARFEESRYPSNYVSTSSLTLAFLLVDEIIRDYPVDPKRIYVLGHSMGGFGSWNAVWAAPERFAAAIPSAGGLLPWKDASRFKDVPIWAFHGTEDPAVPFAFTRDIFDALKQVNGNMKLTHLGGVKHNAADFGFAYEGDDPAKGFITHMSSDRCDPTENVWDWLFKQKLE